MRALNLLVQLLPWVEVLQVYNSVYTFRSLWNVQYSLGREEET